MTPPRDAIAPAGSETSFQIGPEFMLFLGGLDLGFLGGRSWVALL